MSYEFRSINPKIVSELRPRSHKFVTVHRKNVENGNDEVLCVMTERYKKLAERIKYLEVRKDDVWIVTYPKSGTTWTQEMVWLLTHNLDYKTAREILLSERSQFVEFSAIADDIPNTIDGVNNMKPPRNIKTHLPKNMLPDQMWTKKPKMIYVARNPKDVIISFFHHFRFIEGYVGTFEDFAEAIMNDEVYWSPYWDNILDFWKLRDEENVLFLTYEDMKKDLLKVVKQVCIFLEKSYSEEQLEKLVEHLSFDNMKNNDACNYTSLVELRKKDSGLDLPKELTFMRSGKSGSWKKEMSEELASRIDDWSRRKTEGTGYTLWQATNDD